MRDHYNLPRYVPFIHMYKLYSIKAHWIPIADGATHGFFVWETFCPESYTVVFVDQLIPLKVVSSLCGMAPTVGEEFAPRTTKLKLVRRSIRVWWTYNNCTILRSYIEFIRNPLSVGEDVAPRIPITIMDVHGITSLARLGCQFSSDLGRHLMRNRNRKTMGKFPKLSGKRSYIHIPGAWRMLILELGHVYPWSTPPLVKTRPSLENMPPMILIIYMKDHHFWWIQWYLHFHDSFGVYPISNYPSRPHSLLVQPIDWGSFDSWCWAEKEGWWMVIDLFNGPLIDAFFPPHGLTIIKITAHTAHEHHDQLFLQHTYCKSGDVLTAAHVAAYLH